MEKVPIVVAVEAKGNRKEAEVEPKSETGEGNGNKSADAEDVGVSKMDSETEKMLESMKELNKKLMEMTYKGKLTCEYDKKDMKSKTKSNDDDDDEEPVKGCMSWLL